MANAGESGASLPQRVDLDVEQARKLEEIYRKVTAPRTRHDDDQLRILQAIYGILFGFGLKELVEAVMPWASWLPCDWSWWLVLVGGMNVLALGLRFFFVVEEISHYLLFIRAEKREPSYPSLTLFHYPLIIMQACLFYGVCATFKKAVLDINGTRHLSVHEITVLVLVEALLLIVNILWLGRVRYKRKEQPKGLKIKFENRWIIINGACAAVAFATVLLAHGDFARVNVGFPFFVFGAFLAGSVLDLWLTAKFYVPAH
jgi:hypothetical protein